MSVLYVNNNTLLSAGLNSDNSFSLTIPGDHPCKRLQFNFFTCPNYFSNFPIGY